MLRQPSTLYWVIIVGLILSLIIVYFRYQTIKKDYQLLQLSYREKIEVGKLYRQNLVVLHQLDIQHTEELNHAKAELDKLHHAVRAGTKRLRVKTLRETPQPAPPQSRHDEVTSQLGEAAREDYFRLREMMIENEKQTDYLQNYIQTQCLGKENDTPTLAR